MGVWSRTERTWDVGKAAKPGGSPGAPGLCPEGSEEPPLFSELGTREKAVALASAGSRDLTQKTGVSRGLNMGSVTGLTGCIWTWS